MTTRYSSLLSVKKNIVQQKERGVQAANLRLQNAEHALQTSYDDLSKIESPKQGRINDFIANRLLLDSQRALIKHNEARLEYARKDLDSLKQELKIAMIEFEKFKYLDFKEKEKLLEKQRLKEAKELDEMALMGHTRKLSLEFAS